MDCHARLSARPVSQRRTRWRRESHASFSLELVRRLASDLLHLSLPGSKTATDKLRSICLLRHCFAAGVVEANVKLLVV